MKRIGQAVTALALGAMLAAPAAKAQVKFGVEGSAAIPMGDLGDGAETGFGVAGQVLFKPAAIPFGIRIDGAYNSFSAKDEFAEDGGFRTIGGTLSGVFQMSGVGPRPYIVVGPGVYNGSFTGDLEDVVESFTKFGLRGGVGLALPLSGISTAIEASVTNVFTDEDENGFDGLRFVNIGVAIRFGGAGS